MENLSWINLGWLRRRRLSSLSVISLAQQIDRVDNQLEVLEKKAVDLKTLKTMFANANNGVEYRKTIRPLKKVLKKRNKLQEKRDEMAQILQSKTLESGKGEEGEEYYSARASSVQSEKSQISTADDLCDKSKSCSNLVSKVEESKSRLSLVSELEDVPISQPEPS